MANFIQLHYLTTYPPSNPNRDDQGRPKSAMFGGVNRLRLSSQSIKRAARVSPSFTNALKGHLGERTRQFGKIVKGHALSLGADEAKAQDIAEKIANVFGKLDVKKGKDSGAAFIAQLAFLSPDEQAKALELAQAAVDGEQLPELNELKKLILRTADSAADVAMFGRMFAVDPDFNREAAVQVSHAITTHRADIEDDFYTAVDDLKISSEDSGAGFIGDAGFGSGIYYLYSCIDVDLLIENLEGDAELAARSAEALMESLAIATPAGKQNSFSHHPLATYIRVESGNQQPRDLSGAFFKPIRGEDLREQSIVALESTVKKLEKAYGLSAEKSISLNVEKEEGSLNQLKDFVKNAVQSSSAAVDV